MITQWEPGPLVRSIDRINALALLLLFEGGIVYLLVIVAIRTKNISAVWLGMFLV
jgi:hypothetical protein